MWLRLQGLNNPIASETDNKSMTGNLLIDSLISLAAIALMVALAWAVFRTPPGPVTQDAAAERLAFDEPDFRPQHWLIDREGRAVMAEGAGGDIALVSRLGLDLVTRRFPAGAMRVSEEDGALVVRPSDPGSRRLVIEADGAAEWARKINPAGAK
ncbi:hypothetical protein [Hyphococcus sp.]|uniref:hypothetical protein n=1 Tax=Hyphococcus sp. TaxID=2038636 RepID=UPI0035C698C7